MPDNSPECLEIDGDVFFNNVLLHALTLTGTAEGQQGQNPQPDALLALHTVCKLWGSVCLATCPSCPSRHSASN